MESRIDRKTAARYLGVSVSSVTKYVQQRGLPHVRVGDRPKFRISDLDQWLEKQTAPEAPPLPKAGRPKQETKSSDVAEIARRLVALKEQMEETSGMLDTLFKTVKKERR